MSSPFPRCGWSMGRTPAGRRIPPPPTCHPSRPGPPVPGKAFALLPVNLLGRAADNTIVLDENTVSAHHARLSYQQGQWWLEDQGSKNGSGVHELDLPAPLGG